MRQPAPLRTGARIEIVSPASAIVPEKLEAGVKLLESAGYRVTLGEHVFDHTDYLAGRDEDRAADLMRAFRDPAVDAVFCSRGGYGCARLFPWLDLDEMAASNKPFFGFSDITTLHLALNRRGLVTFHAPMLLTFSRKREPWVEESLLGALRGDFSTPEGAATGATVVGGTAKGVVTGGCLCLITDSIGTPDSIDVTNKIVVIEDVDENPHRVDAMLTHLLNTGSMDAAAGFVIGEMTGTDEREDATIGKKPWREIVMDRLTPLRKPMVIDFPVGHCAAMLTLPLGVDATLDADQGTLSY